MTDYDKRVELHLHTNFSKMDALVDINELIRRAAEEGWPAVAITDHNNVQAFPEVQRTSKKYGIKVIYGLEALLSDDASEGVDRKHNHVILLVKNKIGLKHLYELVSYVNTEKTDGVPYIPKSVLEERRDGLLVGSTGRGGELVDAVLSGKTTQELERIAAYYDYLEIQPICNSRFLIHSGAVQNDDELMRLNITIVELARQMQKPFVATGDVHFLDPKDEIARSVLLNATDPLPLYYKSTEEMLKEFSYLGNDAAYCAVVTNTGAIADSIESVEPVPQGIYPPKIEGAEDEIEQKSIVRAEEIYGKPLPAPVKTQLDWELSAIKKNGFGINCAVAERLVKRSNENSFTVRSCGSVAASFVAFLLGITEVNPLSTHYLCDKCRHSEFISASSNITGFELPDKPCPICGEQMRKDGLSITVETFFAEDGSKVPDINLNFANNYRKQATRHLKEIFGQGQVLRAGSVHTISKYLARKYVERYAIDNSVQLSKDEVETITYKLCGVKCGDRLHPSAYLIIPDDMDTTDFCPVSERSGERVTHFDFHSVNDCLISFDIHGHDTPTLLKELEEITETNSRTIPLDDKDTLRLFETADTVALPEFGSDFAMQLLKVIKPVGISDLIKIYGFIHGTGAWEENAEALINDGTASLNEAISTRDDIYTYLTRVGMNRHDAYTVMEYVCKGRFYVNPKTNHADVSAKRRSELEEMLHCHGVPNWYIDSMKKIRYLFPKAHAASFILPIFRIAWYKAHCPMEFYAVMLNRIGVHNLKPNDYKKETADLKAEIEELTNKGVPMCKYEYESNRSRALRLVCDAREHGFCFESSKIHTLSVGSDHSIIDLKQLKGNGRLS